MSAVTSMRGPDARNERWTAQRRRDWARVSRQSSTGAGHFDQQVGLLGAAGEAALQVLGAAGDPAGDGGQEASAGERGDLVGRLVGV